MRYGLIGEKLGHSYSKQIHEMVGGYEYELLEVKRDALEGLVGDSSFSGFNVTIPYKQAVLPFCAELSPAARSIGCVNTLIRRGDGSIFGHNTDFEGFRELASREGISFEGKKVLILGSGGTSRTVSAVALAGGAAEVVKISRGEEPGYGQLERHADAGVIVNTTPVGMYPENGESLISPEAFPALTAVLDVIYNPMETRLILNARERGIACAGGLYMLVRQAVAAAELFLGRDLPDLSGEIYKRIRGQIENVVLIGMPGCGKSRIGRELAGALGRELLDTDELVCERLGTSIPEAFERRGEEFFRAAEREAVSEAGKRRGIVIATGGGAPLFRENRLNLKQNGKIFFLSRGLEKLATEGRPLSADMDALRRMELERRPVYEGFADASIDNNGSTRSAVNRILEVIA